MNYELDQNFLFYRNLSKIDLAAFLFANKNRKKPKQNPNEENIKKLMKVLSMMGVPFFAVILEGM